MRLETDPLKQGSYKYDKHYAECKCKGIHKTHADHFADGAETAAVIHRFERPVYIPQDINDRQKVDPSHKSPAIGDHKLQYHHKRKEQKQEAMKVEGIDEVFHVVFFVFPEGDLKY